MNGPFDVFVKHYFVPTVCPCCGEKICFVADLEGNIIDFIPLKGIEEVMEDEVQKAEKKDS